MKKNSPNEDYTNVFLTHARLVTFADRYAVNKLMKLSLYHLHTTLVSFELFDKRIEDVVSLIEYCYKDDTPEALQYLVRQYTACNVEKLWRSEAFQQLLTERGE